MLEETLSRLGFSPSEIKIFIYLLKNGSSYPRKISSETKINRSNIYEALDRLIARGVISFITKNKVKWFEARKLESIMSLINEKEEEIKNTKNQLIIDLKKIEFNKDKTSLEANVFTGKKGLRMIFEEMLEEKKPISLIASQFQFKEIFGSYFELWHAKRVQRKIEQRSIFPLSYKSKLKEREFLEYKFVDNNFTNPTTTIIYGDNCVFIQWAKEPIAIKINNKEITKSHLNNFNIIWKM